MPAVLLDTHVMLWWLTEPEKVGSKAANAIRSMENPVFVSSVSVWEIAIKFRLGKLPLPDGFLDQVEEIVSKAGWTPLPILLRHARSAGLLNAAHRDPFDRMLAAQAMEEKILLATNDPALRSTGVETIW